MIKPTVAIVAALFTSILLAQAVAQAGTANPSSEPTYNGKPVSYFMDELSLILSCDSGIPHDKIKLQVERLRGAFGSLGLKAVPFILSWDWRKKTGEVNEFAPIVVNAAFRLLSERDRKQLVDRLKQIADTATDPQVVSSLLVTVPALELRHGIYMPSHWLDKDTGDPVVKLAWGMKCTRKAPWQVE